MEPKNHPIENEHHLNETSIFGFKIFILQNLIKTKNPTWKGSMAQLPWTSWCIMSPYPSLTTERGWPSILSLRCKFPNCKGRPGAISARVDSGGKPTPRVDQETARNQRVLGCARKLGSKVNGSVGDFTLIYPICKDRWNNPLILI